MESKEVFDYVMTTPANTNPAVLKGLLDKLSDDSKGDSSLPAPTAAIEGKFIHVVGTPRQQINTVFQGNATKTTEDASIYELANTNLDYFVEGALITLTTSMGSDSSKVKAYDGDLLVTLFPNSSISNGVTIQLNSQEQKLYMKFLNTVPSEQEISTTITSQLYDYSWQAIDGALPFSFHVDWEPVSSGYIIRDTTYDKIWNALNEGRPVTVIFTNSDGFIWSSSHLCRKWGQDTYNIEFLIGFTNDTDYGILVISPENLVVFYKP